MLHTCTYTKEMHARMHTHTHTLIPKTFPGLAVAD